jgi:hypothetical protein
MSVVKHNKEKSVIPSGMTNFIYQDLSTVMADGFQQLLDFRHET